MRPFLGQADRDQDLLRPHRGQTRNVGFWPDEEFIGAEHAFAPRAPQHHLGIERHERGRAVRRCYGNTTVGVEERVLAIDPFGRVGKTGVAAGAIARQTVPVIPAASVLRDVAPNGAGVADLRAGDVRLSLPPASFHASGPCLSSSAKASASVAG